MRHLHSLGIVHRDLKPENICFTTAELQWVKLIDLGAAVRTPHSLPPWHADYADYADYTDVRSISSSAADSHLDSSQNPANTASTSLLSEADRILVRTHMATVADW